MKNKGLLTSREKNYPQGLWIAIGGADAQDLWDAGLCFEMLKKGHAQCS